MANILSEPQEKTLEYEDFCKVYAKYAKKDYFMNKHFIRNRIAEFEILKPELKVTLSEVKKYLKVQKAKSWKFAQERFNSMVAGEWVAKSEKFSWELFNKYGN